MDDKAPTSVINGHDSLDLLSVSSGQYTSFSCLHSYTLFCSLTALDPRVGHTMDVLSPFISVLCHSVSFWLTLPKPNSGWHCRWFSSADYGIEVAQLHCICYNQMGWLNLEAVWFFWKGNRNIWLIYCAYTLAIAAYFSRVCTSHFFLHKLAFWMAILCVSVWISSVWSTSALVIIRKFPPSCLQ